MASVLDVFGRLLLDDTKFEADAEKAGEKAGQKAGDAMSKSMGQRVSTGLKAGLKIAAGAAAAGLAIATSEGLKLNETLNALQAETGATGDAWEAMQKGVRRQNGRTTESLDDISAAFAGMKRDLGLTGVEIEKYQDRIFNAGLATKTSGATIVAAVDNIGDAYGLNVDQSLDAVDQLIKSNQDFGGSLEGNLGILSRFAPALKKLNGTYDDGIALLNLAASAGLNENDVLKALNASAAKFKLPPTLKQIIGPPGKGKTTLKEAKEETTDLLKELKKFETPSKYAQIVADLKKIKDPIQRDIALQKIYAKEVALFDADPVSAYIGILAAIPDDQKRAQKATELFGAKAGPIWAQLAGVVAKNGDGLKDYVADTDAARGAGDNLAKQLDSGPTRSFKLMFESINSGLADLGSNPALTGLASLGTILGGFAPNLSSKIASGFAKAIKGLGRRLLLLIGIEIASAKAEGVIGDKIGDAVAAAADSPGAKAGATKAGGIISKALRAATVVGLAAVAFFIVDQFYNHINDELDKQAGDVALRTQGWMKEASLAELQSAREGIAQQLDKTPLLFGWDVFGGKEKVGRTLDEVDAAITARGGAIPKHVAEEWQHSSWIIDIGSFFIEPFIGAMNTVVANILAMPGRAVGWVQSMIGQSSDAGSGMVSSITGSAGNIVASITGIPTGVIAWVGQLIAQGTAAAGGVTMAIGTGVNTVTTMILAVPGRVASWVGSLVGQATSLATQLVNTVSGAVGRVVGLFLSIPGQVAGIGSRILNGIVGGLSSLPGRIADIVRAAFSGLNINVGPFHITGAGITVDLPKIDIPHLAGGGPLAAGEAAVVGENGPELFVPSVPGTIVPGAMPGGSQPAAQGGDTFNIPIAVTGLLKAETAQDIARHLRLVAQTGYLRPKPRLSTVG